MLVELQIAYQNMKTKQKKKGSPSYQNNCLPILIEENQSLPQNIITTIDKNSYICF